MQTRDPLDPDDFWSFIDQGDARIRAAVGELPLFGVADWTGPLMVGDWEWEDGRLARAGLAHGEPRGLGAHVHVQVSRKDPVDVVHNLRLGAVAPDPDDRTSYLALRRRIAAEPGVPTRIPVEGSPVDFDVWDDVVHWYAAARHGGHGLVVEARDITPNRLALLRVDDIEPYLAGRRAYLRARRGESG